MIAALEAQPRVFHSMGVGRQVPAVRAPGLPTNSTSGSWAGAEWHSIVDASALYAQVEPALEPRHDDVTGILRSRGGGSLATTEVAAAEADYLILDRLGR